MRERRLDSLRLIASLPGHVCFWLPRLHACRPPNPDGRHALARPQVDKRHGHLPAGRRYL